MSLFVSYTRSDQVLVRALKDDLERMGRSVWIDHQIHGGERWWQEIIQQIQDAEVFLFALSKDSWRSPPCRAELSYAEQLRVPVVPVRVGPLENLRIPLAEKQIIDYRQRSADAVIDLIAAVTDLSAQPRQLPDPLPEPPGIPFDYLYRIASQIDVQQIPPDDQGRLIAELWRRLKTEEDNVARKDILMLLSELRARNELTVPHAAEIDEILSGAQAKKVTPADAGVTRLPPSAHWRRSRPGSDPATEQSSAAAPASPPPSSPRPGARVWRRTAESGEGAAPKENAAPEWLTDLINRGGAAETGAGAVVAGTVPRTATRPGDTPARARKWWAEEQSGPEPPEAPTVGVPAPSAQPPTPQSPTPQSPSRPSPRSSSQRFAFIGAVLGAMGMPSLLLGMSGTPRSLNPGVVTLLLFLSALGLSMSVVAAKNREPRSRIAVVIGVVGLLSAIVAVAITLG